MVDARRLAAADMYGTKGSRRRRRLIRIEFSAGVVGCLALGVLALTRGGGTAWLIMGAWLVAIGLNYVPLALSAQSLSRPGALEAEMAGKDVRRELREASVAQLWIVVPLALVVGWLAGGRTRPG